MYKHFTEPQLAALAAAVEKRLSPRRFSHTRGVLDMAGELAGLYCPEAADELRAAALLHDLTKELDDTAQAALLGENGITLRPDEAASPKIWHAITAPLVIQAEFPAFATPTVLSSVRWHTTARAGLSLTEAILYLADGIERGRRYPLALALRERLLLDMPSEREARLARLADVVREMLSATVDFNSGAPICRDTLEALEFVKDQTCFLKGMKHNGRE